MILQNFWNWPVVDNMNIIRNELNKQGLIMEKG